MGFGSPRARVLARAFEEVRRARTVWLGDGLPEALAPAAARLVREAAELAVVAVELLGSDGTLPPGAAPGDAQRLVALSLAPAPRFGPPAGGPRVDLLVGSYGVLAPLPQLGGFEVVAVRGGTSARELQEACAVPLYAGPGLEPFDPAPGPLFAVEGARRGPA